MSNVKRRRIEADLKKVISKLIKQELPDKHRLDLLSVTGVELTPDYRKATVYVSHIKKDEELRKESLKLLRRKEKTIRAGVTRALPLKYIPELRFREDTTLKDAQKITEIMKELKAERNESDSPEQL